MSHTHAFEVAPHVTFTCDGDPRGGDVRIRVFSESPWGNRDAKIEQEIELPYDVLAAFVAEQVRRQRISKLEQMSPEDVLNAR